MRLSSGHPCVENSPPLYQGRASTSPNPSVSECDEAGIFFLDSMYLATEIVLEKTAGPNHSISTPLPATGISRGGYAIQAQPESFSGILSAQNSENKALFSLRTKQEDVSQKLLVALVPAS